VQVKETRVQVHMHNRISKKINKTSNSLSVHPNMNQNWVPPFDSNSRYQVLPFNILVLQFLLQFNSKPKFLHPNTALASFLRAINSDNLPALNFSADLGIPVRAPLLSSTAFTFCGGLSRKTLVISGNKSLFYLP
jgi:hypothetical protein